MDGELFKHMLNFTIDSTEDAKEYKLRNNGRKIVTPTFQVYNLLGTASINSHEITETGKYQFPDIRFPHGETVITLTGLIAVSIRFREGVL